MQITGVDRFGEPDVLRSMSVPMRALGSGQVLVRVAAAAVNPADIAMREGRFRWAEPVRFPLVPGCDVAGTVEAVGVGVVEPVVGDLVIGNTAHEVTQVGGYAEFVVLPVRYLASAPGGIDASVS